MIPIGVIDESNIFRELEDSDFMRTSVNPDGWSAYRLLFEDGGLYPGKTLTIGQWKSVIQFLNLWGQIGLEGGVFNNDKTDCVYVYLDPDNNMHTQINTLNKTSIRKIPNLGYLEYTPGVLYLGWDASDPEDKQVSLSQFKPMKTVVFKFGPCMLTTEMAVSKTTYNSQYYYYSVESNVVHPKRMMQTFTPVGDDSDSTLSSIIADTTKMVSADYYDYEVVENTPTQEYTDSLMKSVIKAVSGRFISR